MIEHFGELAFVCSNFSVAKSEVAVNSQPPCVMVMIIGTVECVFLDHSKVGLNDVEPGCIRWRPNGDNFVC